MAAERPPVYADENLDRLLIEAVRLRGVDLLTTREAGQLGASDEQQLTYATSVGRVVLTHDRGDFRRLHRKWLEAGRPHGGVVTIPQLGSAARRGIRAALLLDWLAVEGDPTSRFVVWGQLEAWLRAGRRLEGYTEHEVRLALGLVET